MQLPVVDDPTPDRWYADGLRFSCTQCGNCCTGGPGYVWVSPTEIDRLAAHLALPRDTVIRDYTRSPKHFEGRVSLKETRTPAGLYDCIFLKTVGQRRTCSIYPVRPLQCRTWPFWNGLLDSPDAWKSASRGCPGIDRGTLYAVPQIHALRDATDWPDVAATPTSPASPPPLVQPSSPDSE